MKHLPNGKRIRFLHYVDDILVDSNDEAALGDFFQRIKQRFDLEVKPRADWYLQTRINQDKDKNITLDQTRYCKSMIQRFLPTLANQEPTRAEARVYVDPVKPNAPLSKADRSKSQEEVLELEREYGFRYLELIGCFNWLSYTCLEELYAIRKLCRFMSLPGRPHFLAALHLLHHFRCHPPHPLIFYHNVEHAPVSQMLASVPNYTDIFRHSSDGCPNYVVFADSSHGDAEEGRSTACDLHVYQGGVIDHHSWVPDPVPLSTAESENNCYSAAVMRAIYLSRVINMIRTGAWGYVAPTIPVCVDNNAAITMNESENITRRVRHVESRQWFGRKATQDGRVKWVKVDGKTQQPADLGTKPVPSGEAKPYLSWFEAPYYT